MSTPTTSYALRWTDDKILAFGPDSNKIVLSENDQTYGHAIRIVETNTSGSTPVEHDAARIYASRNADCSLYLEPGDNSFARLRAYEDASLELRMDGYHMIHLATTPGNAAYLNFDYCTDSTDPERLAYTSVVALGYRSGTSDVGGYLKILLGTDLDSSPSFDINFDGLKLPYDFASASATTTRNNTSYFNTFDSEFLSELGNSNKQSLLKKTIPSTYAVRQAIAAAVPAPFSFVVKTDSDGNDYFGIKFTDPQNSNKTKTAWFNFATKTGSVSAVEWENRALIKT